MADKDLATVFAENPLTAPSSDDVGYVLDDPGGTPTDAAATYANIITKAHGLSDGVIKVASSVMTDAVEGTDYYAPGGTDVAITDGGTGASTASAALAALGANPFAQTALKILDASTHQLTIKDNETNTGNKTLNLKVNDADRTIDLSGNLTVPAAASVQGTFSGTSSGTNTGDQTNISGNAATVTTNANLTGPITSSGNATAIASQTGTGTKFVVDTSPTIAGHITLEGVTATGATGTGKIVYDGSPTIVTPTVASLANMNHTHADSAGGGTLSATTALGSGTVPTARLGSGTASANTELTGAQTYVRRPRMFVTEAGTQVTHTTGTTATSIFASPYTFAAGELAVGDMIVLEVGAIWVCNASSGTRTLTLSPFLGTGTPTAYTSPDTAASASGRSTIVRAVWRVTSATTAGCAFSILQSSAVSGSALLAANCMTISNSSAITIADISSSTNIFDFKASFASTTSTQQFTPIIATGTLFPTP